MRAVVERELVPAVRAAWRCFPRRLEGPGGVGIELATWRCSRIVVSRFANDDAVAGYDLMNEPNQFLPENQAALSEFYEDALGR